MFVTFGDGKRTVTMPVAAIRQVIYQEYIVTRHHLEQCGQSGEDRTQWRVDVIHDYGKETFIFHNEDAEASASQLWVDIDKQLKAHK